VIRCEVEKERVEKAMAGGGSGWRRGVAMSCRARRKRAQGRERSSRSTKRSWMWVRVGKVLVVLLTMGGVVWLKSLWNKGICLLWARAVCLGGVEGLVLVLM
jgi:hypothetical protein